MSHRSRFLDVKDPLPNLKFVENEFQNELERMFNRSGDRSGPSAPPRDFKVVTPRPGFCLKTYKVNTNEKYFVNVCQTEEIPAPEDITEEELVKILQSEAPSSFRIPMSISEPRIARDKSDNPVDVTDIAINPQFFVKCEKSTLFKDFFLALIAEALNDKYNVQIKLDRAIILNNRKFIGTLLSHRVRNNDVKTVLESYQNPSEADLKKLDSINKTQSNGRGPLVQELSTNEVNALKKSSKTLMQQKSVLPEYRLRAKVRDEEVEELQAEFYLPNCISSRDFTLDIGEDRIQLESLNRGYCFDKFVNYHLNQDRTRAIFDKTTKMLQVRIPVE